MMVACDPDDPESSRSSGSDAEAEEGEEAGWCKGFQEPHCSACEFTAACGFVGFTSNPAS